MSNTSIDNAGASNQDDDAIPFASEGEQHGYWAMAMIANTMGVMALLYLAWVTFIEKNEGMRSMGAQTCYLLLLGDAVFVGSYFPYHIGNLMRGTLDEGTGCTMMTYTGLFAIFAEFGGVLLIPIVTKEVVEEAIQMKQMDMAAFWRRPWVQCYIAAWLLGGVGWGILVTFAGNPGSFRGLYCVTQEWKTPASALPMFLPIIFVTSLGSWYYFKIYKLLQTNSLDGEGKMAKSVLVRGMVLVVLFFTFWGPFALSCLLNLIKVYPPVWYDILCGILAKLKVAVDVYTVWSLPAVQKARKDKRVLQLSTVASDDSDANEVASA